MQNVAERFETDNLENGRNPIGKFHFSNFKQR